MGDDIAKSSEKKPEAHKLHEPMVYVGPSDKRVPISQFDIMSEGPTDELLDRIKRAGVQGAHFIPISEYSKNHQKYASKSGVRFRNVKLVPRVEAKPQFKRR